MRTGNRSKSPSAPNPAVEETPWGYALRAGQRRKGSVLLQARLMRIAGLVIIFVAYAQWLVPSSGDPILPPQATAWLMLAVAMGGALLYWIADLGTVIETEVDLTRRALTRVEKDLRGRTWKRQTIAMADVGALRVIRPGPEVGLTRLVAKQRKSGKEIVLAEGSSAWILALHKRLSEDLLPVEQRIERRLRKKVEFRSCRDTVVPGRLRPAGI